jgi:hypothetical protein
MLDLLSITQEQVDEIFAVLEKHVAEAETTLAV